MDPRLGLGIHQYSLEFWTFTIEKVGKLCTLLMRREGGKYTKTKLRCTCEFLRVVGEGESWCALTSASSWGGMRMWWWACGCQDDHLCNTLSFQEPWLLSSLNLKADIVWRRQVSLMLEVVQPVQTGPAQTAPPSYDPHSSWLQPANLSVPLRGKVPPSRWPLTGSLHSGVTVLHRAVGQLWSCCVKLWKRSDGHSMPLSRQSRCQVSQRRASAKLASRRWVWWDL